MSEIAEIELRYYDQKSQQSWIIDCVLLEGKVKPAWEFRSDFVKSKTNGVANFRSLDLYYIAKVPVGTYLCRFTKAGSDSQNLELEFFSVTKDGLVKSRETPRAVEEAFAQNNPYQIR